MQEKYKEKAGEHEVLEAKGSGEFEDAGWEVSKVPRRTKTERN